MALTCKIYSLNFQVSSTTSLVIVTMPHIMSLELSHLGAGVCALLPTSLHLPSPQPLAPFYPLAIVLIPPSRWSQVPRSNLYRHFSFHTYGLLPGKKPHLTGVETKAPRELAQGHHTGEWRNGEWHAGLSDSTVWAPNTELDFLGAGLE